MQYHVGQIVQGTITGIQPYGAFVALDNKTSGLIHISEISDGFVKDVHNYVNENEKVNVKIIDIDDRHHQVRLSLKAVQPNNFRKERKRHRPGTMPQMKLGFKTIEENLNQWVEEAKEAARNAI